MLAAINDPESIERVLRAKGSPRDAPGKIGRGDSAANCWFGVVAHQSADSLVGKRLWH